MSSGEAIMKGSVEPFAAELKKMINNKEMSDIKFLIGPNRKAIYCHKVILSSRCDVFRAMFIDLAQQQNGDKEVPFVMSDITPDIFLAVMEFLYTNCVTLNNKIAIDVLGSSIEFGIEELRKLCNQYLIDNLGVSNACDVLQAAVTFSQEELRQRALEFAEQNTQSVFKTKGFHEMTDDALAAILASDKLHVDEMEIIECVREWATVNSVVLGKPISEISKRVSEHLRLPLLTANELREVEEENVKDRLIPVEHVSFAWKSHALQKGDRSNPLMRPRKGTKPRDFHKNYV